MENWYRQFDGVLFRTCPFCGGLMTALASEQDGYCGGGFVDVSCDDCGWVVVVCDRSGGWEFIGFRPDLDPEAMLLPLYRWVEDVPEKIAI